VDPGGRDYVDLQDCIVDNTCYELFDDPMYLGTLLAVSNDPNSPCFGNDFAPSAACLASLWPGIFPDGGSAGAAIKARFNSIGYDVADRHLLSGLSNCALSEAELADLRREWTDRINRFGLFEEVESAVGFKEVCDQLVPEHAPFCAYRIRKVEVDWSLGSPVH
jgi:hypothetical protein